VLVIVPVDRERPALAGVGATAAAVQDVLEAVDSESTLMAAISSRCTDARAFVRAYEEARQVMSCVRSLADDDRPVVLTADDLGSGRLLLASSSRAEAERFAHDALGPLLTAGDDTMAELLRTLQVFFAGARSVRRAAERLGVHENTIRYRLARIHHLTGLAVGSDSDDDLTAHLALLIVRVQRLATAPVIDGEPPERQTV
jgi:sugar diacid utilization regulator